MTTWRERIAEARARGSFTPEDPWLVCATSTCAVGEIEHTMGREPAWYAASVLSGEESGPGGWTVGVRHSSAFTGAVLADDMAAAERLLDAIEDRALALKREQAG